MKALVLKHKPKDYSQEEFRKLWDNNHHIRDVIVDVLNDLVKQNKGVKLDDFDCPNHYAKIAYKEGKAAAYEDLIDMLQSKSS